MYNRYAVKPTIRLPYLLFALVVAAFVTLYPQLDAAGYCGNDGCPEVSYPAHAAGAAAGGAVSAGVSFVVAALVVVPGVVLVRQARLVLRAPPQDMFTGTVFPPETPPPRFFA